MDFPETAGVPFPLLNKPPFGGSEEPQKNPPESTIFRHEDLLFSARSFRLCPNLCPRIGQCHHVTWKNEKKNWGGFLLDSWKFLLQVFKKRTDLKGGKFGKLFWGETWKMFGRKSVFLDLF